MRKATRLSLLLCLAAAACSKHQANIVSIANTDEPVISSNIATPPGNASGNAHASGASRDQVLRTETVTGTFAGWQMADYLWAQIHVPGRETINAQPGPPPIDLFLDANRGRPVTVEVATVRTEIPEAGGMVEIQRITAARNASTTADAWWQGLSAADRAAAQRRFDAGALSGG